MDVPFITDSDLENLAFKYRQDAILRGVAKTFPFEVEDALERVHDFLVEFDCPLEEGVFGSTDFIRKTVLISSQCPNDGHRQFTVAHELGHIFLHEKILSRVGEEANQTSFFELPVAPSIPKNDRLELQADRFAAAILMPRLEFFERFGTDFSRISESVVAQFFGVSRHAARIRIEVLQKLIHSSDKGLQFSYS